VRLNRSDREVLGAGSIVFALLATMLAFAALVTAAQNSSRLDKANRRIAKLSESGLVTSTSKLTLEEFTITPHPALVSSGKVTLVVSNVGAITHELVLVRATSPDALPTVKVAGERPVGAVDEEAIPEANKMGETGDIPARTTVTKTFDLKPGTYVMFCNIDNKDTGAPLNHFVHGMTAALTVI
jgi:hypothetical protein